MLYIMKNLLAEIKKLPENLKTEGKGVCHFCGRETLIVRSSEIESILKGDSNVGITKAFNGLPFVCIDCFKVLKILGKTAPSSIYKALGSKVAIIGENYWTGIRNFEDFKKIPEGIYAVLYLIGGSVLPPAEMHKIDLSCFPTKAFVVNVVNGASLDKVFLTIEDIKEKRGYGKVIASAIEKSAKKYSKEVVKNGEEV